MAGNDAPDSLYTLAGAVRVLVADPVKRARIREETFAYLDLCGKRGAECDRLAEAREKALDAAVLDPTLRTAATAPSARHSWVEGRSGSAWVDLTTIPDDPPEPRWASPLEYEYALVAALHDQHCATGGFSDVRALPIIDIGEVGEGLSPRDQGHRQGAWAMLKVHVKSETDRPGVTQQAMAALAAVRHDLDRTVPTRHELRRAQLPDPSDGAKAINHIGRVIVPTLYADPATRGWFKDRIREHLGLPESEQMVPSLTKAATDWAALREAVIALDAAGQNAERAPDGGVAPLFAAGELGELDDLWRIWCHATELRLARVRRGKPEVEPEARDWAAELLGWYPEIRRATERAAENQTSTTEKSAATRQADLQSDDPGGGTQKRGPAHRVLLAGTDEARDDWDTLPLPPVGTAAPLRLQRALAHLGFMLVDPRWKVNRFRRVLDYTGPWRPGTAPECLVKPLRWARRIADYARAALNDGGAGGIEVSSTGKVTREIVDAAIGHVEDLLCSLQAGMTENGATGVAVTRELARHGQTLYEAARILDAQIKSDGAKAQASGSKPNGAAAPASASTPCEPLPDKPRAVWELLNQLPEGAALKGPEIIDRLAKRPHNPAFLDQSTLTKHIIPVLKPRGVRNRRGAGYYIDRGAVEQ